MSYSDITIDFDNCVDKNKRELFRVGNPEICCKEWIIRDLFKRGMSRKVNCELVEGHDGTHMSLTDNTAFNNGFCSDLWFREDK